jgi:hypothetical protein
MELMEQRASNIIFRGFTRRAHLTINKYDGSLNVLHASADGKGGIGLFLNDQRIPTASDDVDFPFLALALVPIGHIQAAEPE